MAISELRKKQEELRRKIETTERVQWKGRYKAQLFEVERKHYRKIIEKTESKAVKGRYEKAIKRSYRRQTAIKSYEKRVKKGTDALTTFTKEQRKEFAAKAAQTRIENRLKKQEWDNLTRGQKISRGKQMAKERKQRRQEAGRKAYQTRKLNETMLRLELAGAMGNVINTLLGNYDKAGERTRENEGSNEAGTDLEKLADIYLEFGQFASEKTMATLSKNPEFQKILAEKMAARTSSNELKAMFTGSASSVGHKFLEIALKSPNIYNVQNPYNPGQVKEVAHTGLSSSDWFKKSWQADVERERQQRLYDQFEVFREALQRTHEAAKAAKVSGSSKKINFEYKPGKKWS